jgi:uncharacterized protein YjiK
MTTYLIDSIKYKNVFKARNIVCCAMAICLFSACQPDAAPLYKLTRHKLNGIQWGSGLTYAWGDLWAVADRDSNLIYHMTTNGKLLDKFRLKLSDAYVLLEKQKKILKHNELDLEGITADEKRDLLYVLSEANRAVLRISPKGDLLDFFPVQGHDTKHNQGLEGIAYSTSANCLYIAEEGPWVGPKKIYRYTPDGELLSTYQFDLNYRCTSLCIQNESLLLINSTSPVPSRCQIYELKMPLESNDPKLVVDLGQDFGLTRNYEGITCDKQGNVYLINDAQDERETELIKLSPLNILPE